MQKKKKDAEGDGCEIEDEELRTFHFGVRIGTYDGERWPDDGEEKGSSTRRAHIRIEGKKVSLEKRSELEFQVAAFLLSFLVITFGLGRVFCFPS